MKAERPGVAEDQLHILPEGSGEDPIVITLRQSTSLSTAEALLQAFAFVGVLPFPPPDSGLT